MNIEKLEKNLKDDMTINGITHKRYYHSLGVAKATKELAIIHNINIDLDKAYVSGLLHDVTKLIPLDIQKEMLYDLGFKDDDEIMKSHNVWHGITAPAYVIKKYEIIDDEILDAIRYHVMGRPNMTILEKLVFIADYIEENRVGKVFETAREIAKDDLNKAVLYILESQIAYIKSRNEYLVSQTIKTYDYYKERVK